MKSGSSMAIAYFTRILAFFILQGAHANFLSAPIARILAFFILQEAHANFLSAPIASLLPSSCESSANFRGPMGESTLSVVHTNGPCYKGESSKEALTLAQILSQDESRVHRIQSQHASNNITDNNTMLDPFYGLSLRTAEHIVTVGLGTPTKYHSLILDTGSDFTWTQCSPCLAYCYDQKNPIFNPSQSISYSNVSCAAHECSWLPGNLPRCYEGTTCTYSYHYYDKSFSYGFLAKETLTLGKKDMIPKFVFGCGQNNSGILYGRADGVLGLSRSNFSLMYQAADKYKKFFSYCLPTINGTDGYLRFGKGGISKNVKYTPLSRPRSRFYMVDMLGIRVAGQLLHISPPVFTMARTAVDSGTTLTHLPPPAYSALRDSFRQHMTTYKLMPPYGVLDTCYDVTGLYNVTVPEVTFIFRGNVSVDLGINGILIYANINKTRACLAFIGNKKPDDLGFFGNVQQQTQQVVYDVAGEKLGFAPHGCS